MKERPILFNTESVRAILDGSKVQTRRVVKPQPDDVGSNILVTLPSGMKARHGGFAMHPNAHSLVFGNMVKAVYCPHGIVGDRLYVRETFIPKASGTIYKADYDSCEAAGLSGLYGGWKPSLFMPKREYRILLEIVGERVERVRRISHEDALAEGIERTNSSIHSIALERFQRIWDAINKKRGFGWDTNPYVWVYEFKVLEVKGR